MSGTDPHGPVVPGQQGTFTSEPDGRPRFEYSNTIGRRDANRAIYFDFEGCKGQPPALLGVLFGTTFELLVLDERLSPLVEAGPIPSATIRTSTLAEAIDYLGRKASTGGNRRLVAFSEHELLAVHDHVEPATARDVAARYLNARKHFAAWWRTAFPGARLEEDSLEHCATAVGYAWPDDDIGSPAKALRRLSSQLETAARRGHAPKAATVSLWRSLVQYNRHDCLAMQFVVKHVAERRDAAQRAARHLIAQQRLARRAGNRRRARRTDDQP
jgi:hypothetical protein